MRCLCAFDGDGVMGDHLCLLFPAVLCAAVLCSVAHSSRPTLARLLDTHSHCTNFRVPLSIP